MIPESMGEVYNLCAAGSPALERQIYTLRDRNTRQTEFRATARIVGLMMGYEIAKLLPTRKVNVNTPMNFLGYHRIPVDSVIVGIARAGLVMVDGMAEAFPTAELGFIGAARDEETLQVTISYNGAPTLGSRSVVIADPMLATGGSMAGVIARLRKENGEPEQLIAASIFATQTGIDRVLEEHPEVTIVTAVIDPILNEKGYIVPGCGDFGDRCFGLKHK